MVCTTSWLLLLANLPAWLHIIIVVKSKNLMIAFALIF